MKIAPASFNFEVTELSYVGMKLFNIFDAAVVLIPSVQNKSLTPIGIPSKGPD